MMVAKIFLNTFLLFEGVLTAHEVHVFLITLTVYGLLLPPVFQSIFDHSDKDFFLSYSSSEGPCC